LAQALAERLRAPWLDIDREFEADAGPIAAVVAKYGWAAFRAREAELVERCVRPGAVVSPGGGAVETEAVRAVLAARAFVVWLDGDAALLRARLAADPQPRPSVTGAPVLDEVDALLARRRPLYSSLAHLRVDAALPVAQQVDAALTALAAPCRWPGTTGSA
jgi:shikimate kinase